MIVEVRALVVSLVAIAACSCGGSPVVPGPVTPPPPPPPANTAPVIESIVASVTRVEVDTDVTLTANVKDTETAVSQLKFEWKADVGTITGEGPVVKWRAAKGATTPSDQTIRLTVTETYGTGQQNVVNGTSPVIRLHDSPKELGDLGLTFLGDFANSSISPSTCIRNFSDGCRGKADEKSDIEFNREHYVIEGSSLRLREVRVGSSGMSADVRIACGFTSRIVKCDSKIAGCVVGSVGSVSGDCVLTGVYEQQKWWLCTSNFNPSGQVAQPFRPFFRRPE